MAYERNKRYEKRNSLDTYFSARRRYVSHTSMLKEMTDYEN